MADYVAFIHGIGVQTPASFSRFENSVRQAYVRHAGHDNLVWETAYWADITEPAQQAFEARVPFNGMARHFLIRYLGDVIAYAARYHWEGMHEEIVGRFSAGIGKLSENARKAGDGQAKLNIVAHSMGALIAMDALWSLQDGRKLPENLTLSRFITMGSPVPLYAALFQGLRPDHAVRPAVWVNLYYAQDVLAFPVRVAQNLPVAVTHDIKLSPLRGSGALRGVARTASSLVPVMGAIRAHRWYFSDRRAINEVARALAGAWDNVAEPSPRPARRPARAVS